MYDTKPSYLHSIQPTVGSTTACEISLDIITDVGVYDIIVDEQDQMAKTHQINILLLASFVLASQIPFSLQLLFPSPL